MQEGWFGDMVVGVFKAPASLRTFLRVSEPKERHPAI